MSGTTSISSGISLDASESGRAFDALVTLVVVAAATVLVYSNTFDASFHFDDFPSIVRNTSLRDLRSQWPPSGSRWLGNLSFALNYRFGGLEVTGYHVVNLVIHVCNGLLVAWLAAITLRTPALQGADAGPLLRRYLPLTAGLLFAAHPIATQAVTYVVQRFASLATLFYLLSLVLYARARLSLEAGRRWNVGVVGLYGLSLVAAACAMKTKEIALTLPFAAAGYELLLFRPGRRLLLLAPLAATVLIVPLGLMAPGRDLATALGDVDHLTAETTGIPRAVYLATQTRVLVTYLRLLALPVRQNLDYDFPLSYSPFEPAVLFAVAVLVALGALAVFLLRRARRTNRATGALVFLGVAWFFITSSVESSIIPIRDVIFEHRLYLPAAGAAVAFGTLLLGALERIRSSFSPALQVAGALLVTAGPLGAAAHARNAVWKDELTLWSDVVSKSPGKWRPHNNLGEAYRKSGRPDDAMREYREAIRLNPRSADAHNNLGLAYQARGRLDDAMREYREAIGLDPRSAVAHNNLGLAYRASGRLDDAMREYREAIRIDPPIVEGHVNLGVAYGLKGQIDDAIRELREAIRLDPWSGEAHDNLGIAYGAKGRFDDAVREHREAIRLLPLLPVPHNNLGFAYAAKGQLDDAIREYGEAIRLDPSYATAHGNLATAYRAKGQFDRAAYEWGEAVRLGAGDPLQHRHHH